MEMQRTALLIWVFPRLTLFSLLHIWDVYYWLFLCGFVWSHFDDQQHVGSCKQGYLLLTIVWNDKKQNQNNNRANRYRLMLALLIPWLFPVCVDFFFIIFRKTSKIFLSHSSNSIHRFGEDKYKGGSRQKVWGAGGERRGDEEITEAAAEFIILWRRQPRLTRVRTLFCEEKSCSGQRHDFAPRQSVLLAQTASKKQNILAAKHVCTATPAASGGASTTTGFNESDFFGSFKHWFSQETR